MRKRRATPRVHPPDPVYGSVLVTRLINGVMRRGKKSVAERIVYDALKLAEKELNKPPLEILNKVLEHVQPLVEVRARRIGGASYQVPVEVRPSRRLSLAIRWIVNYARKRHERTMVQKLAGELTDAYRGQGGAIKKREDVHRMAEANKAFAHYKW